MSGDAIDDNLWEGANEYDLLKKVHTDDEYESDREGGVVGAKDDEVKNEKKKRKLSILRELKRAKSKPSAEDNSFSNEPTDTNSSVTHVYQMSSSEMAEEVRKLIQAFRKGSRGDDGNHGETIFSSENYSSPVSDGHAPSSSIGGGKLPRPVCPFVRSLIAGLPSYKKALRVSDAVEHRGSPFVVIVCASALRATKIIKSLSTHKHTRCKVAKLFAKHIKIAEQIEMLAAETYPIAIGTPNRLTKLLGLGALHLQNTRLVLVDVTEDVKSMTILSMNGVREDLSTLLDSYIAKELKHAKIALVRDKKDTE